MRAAKAKRAARKQNHVPKREKPEKLAGPRVVMKKKAGKEKSGGYFKDQRDFAAQLRRGTRNPHRLRTLYRHYIQRQSRKSARANFTMRYPSPQFEIYPLHF